MLWSRKTTVSAVEIQSSTVIPKTDNVTSCFHYRHPHSNWSSTPESSTLSEHVIPENLDPITEFHRFREPNGERGGRRPKTRRSQPGFRISVQAPSLPALAAPHCAESLHSRGEEIFAQHLPRIPLHFFSFSFRFSNGRVSAVFTLLEFCGIVFAELVVVVLPRYCDGGGLDWIGLDWIGLDWISRRSIRSLEVGRSAGMAQAQASLHTVVRPSLQSTSTTESSKVQSLQNWQVFRTTLCNAVDSLSISYSRGCLQGGAHRFLAKSSRTSKRRSVNRSPVIARTSGLRSVRFSGATITEDRASRSASDEVPGSRASYSTDSDSGDEAEYSLAFDNEVMPGFTVVGIDGMDQDNLLMDVTLSFYEMGISVQSAQLLSEKNRVVDVFVVFDAETKAAIPEDRWPDIKEMIFSKLKRRIILNTAAGDPDLAEQVTFLTQTLNKAVRGDGREDVLEAAYFLQNGFEELRRKEDPRLRADLLRYIEKMKQPKMTAVIRLFYLYSSLLNVADEAHSHRLRREQVWASRNATPLWYASFDHSIRAFKKENVGAAELQELFNRTEYNPVFTAHPTEARRREVLTCLHRIFVFLNDREDPRLSPAQKAEVEEEIEAEVEILWRTDEMRASKPTVLEEIMTGLDYFRYSLFEAVCITYRYAENSVNVVYPDKDLVVPSFIKFGSWIGGDRDGNPFVKPETTVMAALLASRLILAEYIRRVRACQDTLTHSLLICQVSPELLKSLEEDKKVMKQILAIRFDGDLFEHEPYRLKLRVMRHRLEQRLRDINARLRELGKAGMRDELLIDIEFNIDEIPGLDPKKDAYVSEVQFLEDLKLIDSSLRKNGDVHLADRKLKDLIRLAETFGFYCCALDVRQESTIHSEATNEIMRLLGLHSNYSSLPEAERMKLLAEAISTPPPVDKVEELYKTMTEPSRKVVELFFACADIMENISQKSIASYVTSMTRQASHVMEVLFLGWFSCKNLLEKKTSGEWRARLVVAPLFETIPDLENMPGSLEALFKNETYKAILMASGGVQEVMLGYSDSCKDGGTTASAYNLYKAQCVIQKLTNEAGVKSCIFHGRGGTVGRGASPTHESILSQPPGSVDGQIKFTEQGEVITYRYGNAQTAAYELTVGITGLLKASHPATRPGGNYEKYFPIMEQLAKAAEKSYRDLTDETEGFYDYFYQATVVNEIGLINIGSRPARRNATIRDKTSLRAIPWVFGWAQSRHTLPAWYGVGSGIANFIRDEPGRIKELQTMYQEWPFFRTFLSNVQMSLFKASMEIAQEYARLCSNRITQKLVFDLVAQEYGLTKAQFLMVSQQNKLLQDNPSLESSFGTRRKYLDPLNHLQVILLGRQRDPTASEEQKPLWEKPLLRTIKAIASNMRNTG